MFEDIDTLWMDGEFVDWEDAQIHALSHVVHYGSGVFEGIRCYETDDGPALFRPEEHYQRFEESAAAIEMDIPHSREELLEATRGLIDRTGIHTAYIRPFAFYGYGALGYANYDDCSVRTMIAAYPKGRRELEPLDVQVSSWRRIHPSQVPTTAKLSGMYLNSILAQKEAAAGGFDYSILLNHDGYVAEGSTSNVFVVRNGAILTPGVDSGILEGITRQSVMTLAEDLGYEVREKPVSTAELYTADEIFFTGTSAEFRPVGQLGGEEVGDGTAGPVTTELFERFDEVVTGQDEEYAHWLEHV